jgi:hypothetical protein
MASDTWSWCSPRECWPRIEPAQKQMRRDQHHMKPKRRVILIREAWM